MMPETQIRPIGIVLEPKLLVRSPFEQEPSVDRQEVLAGINAFIVSLGLDLPFSETELLEDPETGMILLQSPALTTAVTYIENGKQKVLHISSNEQMGELQIRGAGLENKAEQLRQFINLGNGLMMITFAIKFSLPKLGAESRDGVFSMIMSQKDRKKEPVLVAGKKQELSEALGRGNEKQAKPIIFSRAIYNKLDGLIGQAEQTFSGKFARPHENLINDEESTVKDVEFWSQNGNFFGVVTLHMVDGSKRGFVFNKGKQESNGEFVQGSNFIVNTLIDGEPAIAVVKQNRINADFANHGEVTLELPRGFDNRALAKNAMFLVEEEAGLSTDVVLRNIKTQLVLREDPSVTTVHGRLLLIDLPPETDFALSNKREANPQAKIEELVPSWMKLTDVLELIKKGESLVDAHSVAMIAVWVANHNLLQLKPGVEEMAVVFEQYQDLIDGQNYLALPRGSGYLISLLGQDTPNSGATRMKNRTYISTAENSNLNSLVGDGVVLTMAEIWQKIANSEFDNVTLTSLFKCLVQYDLLEYQKPA